MNKKVLSFQLATTYIGAIVGAGFASGQELMQFFVIFGFYGLIGVFLSGTAFALMGYFICQIVIKNKIHGYQTFLIKVLGNKIGLIVDIWITISIFMGLGIMLAGCAAVLQEKLFVNYYVGIIVSSVIVLIALFKGERGVLGINSILIPMLIIITILVSFASIGFAQKEVFQAGENPLIGKQWGIALLLYVSYNMVTSLVIITSIDHYKLKAGIKGFLFGGVLLGIIGLIMVYAMQLFWPEILTTEIPMLYLTEGLDSRLSFLYALAMLSAMLTTAVANGFGLITRVGSLFRMKQNNLSIAIVFMALPISVLGFGNLIGHFYPVFGYVGALIILAVLYKQIKQSCKILK
ncbi:YkvI family membrane protein [Desulfitibacter alkalitolerans]|uniref:YkvI family membrane protein n=1 Tax=Desulfitibacter alkalitolerans TaxID=264641 RepID=UPI0004877826|nr:hypothetical protein [Desulfitibacter alkalitolerans]